MTFRRFSTGIFDRWGRVGPGLSGWESLRLGRISGLLPGGESAQQGGDAGESVLEQGERRTGAGFFRWSGAVGDNPIVFIQFAQAGGQFIFGDVERAGDVQQLERFGAAHIQEDGLIVLEGL